jgi:hypothetical protein
MRNRFLFCMALFLTACEYSAPLDPLADQSLNTIQGNIVLNGPDEVGDVIILVYDVANPPPPTGTGRPVNFATVPAESFEQDLNGLLSAEFAVPLLPDGTFLVSALMDLDADFHPLIAGGALAGSTCGDWVGAYVDDVLDPQLVPVSVSGGRVLSNITVPIANEVPLERPAFFVPPSSIVNRGQAGSSPTTPQLFSLDSTAIASSAGLTLTGPFAGTNPCDTAFAVMVMDLNGDGLPDPHPIEAFAEIGALDIWPRIYLSYAGVPQENGTFESDLVAGETYVGESLIYPSFLASPDFPLNTPVLLTSLDVIWIPSALHQLPTGSETLISNPLTLPEGAWAVSAISFTGQTWTVPNSLASFDSLAAEYDPLSQFSYLWVE